MTYCSDPVFEPPKCSSRSHLRWSLNFTAEVLREMGYPIKAISLIHKRNLAAIGPVESRRSSAAMALPPHLVMQILAVCSLEALGHWRGICFFLLGGSRRLEPGEYEQARARLSLGGRSGGAPSARSVSSCGTRDEVPSSPAVKSGVRFRRGEFCSDPRGRDWVPGAREDLKRA